MPRILLVGLLALPLVYGCPSATVDEPDTGTIVDTGVDAGVVDSGTPDSGTPDAGMNRIVRATNIAPSLGTARGGSYSVAGRIPPPTSQGTASNGEHTVTGGAR